MKYFQMKGSINEELLNRFIDFYNANINEEIKIVLNTGGGDKKIAETIIDMINNHNKITLAMQCVFSAGMQIAVNTKCSKELNIYSAGMWHYGKWTVDVTDRNIGYYQEDIAVIKNFPIHKKSSELFAKNIMNKKELKKFKKGDDVYFNLKRMKEIFPEAKII